MEDVESVGSCSPCNSMIRNESFVHTEDQTQHFQGSPELKTSRGKMTMALLLGRNLIPTISSQLSLFFSWLIVFDLLIVQYLYQYNVENNLSFYTILVIGPCLANGCDMVNVV